MSQFAQNVARSIGKAPGSAASQILLRPEVLTIERGATPFNAGTQGEEMSVQTSTTETVTIDRIYVHALIGAGSAVGTVGQQIVQEQGPTAANNTAPHLGQFRMQLFNGRNPIFSSPVRLSTLGPKGGIGFALPVRIQFDRGTTVRAAIYNDTGNVNALIAIELVGSAEQAG